LLIATATADEPARRKKLVECINTEMDKENTEKDFKLRPDELKNLKEIVDKEVMKEPLKPHTKEEQEKVLKEIEVSAKKDLPGVPTPTVDKMMMRLKELGMHCAKEASN
jgi:hypothetical protein